MNDESIIKEQNTIWTKRLHTKVRCLKSNSNVLSKILRNRAESIITVQSPYHQSNSTIRNENIEESPIITINISGIRYQTYLSTVERYPETLLGNKHKRIYYWNSETNEYFFDRHRTCFESILYYYQSNGRLRRPDYVPLDTFLEEISFFQLGAQAIALTNRSENIIIIQPVPLPKWFWRQYIWFYLEYPQHSIFARILHVISLCLTVISCLSLAIETLPEFDEKWDNICRKKANISLESAYVPRCSELFTSPFFIIETICVSYFTIEFLLRLISTPSYCHFISSLLNWTDLAAIIPYYVFLCIQLTDRKIDLNASTFIILRLLRLFRFLRVFKIYLIFRRLKSLQVLSATLKESYVDFTIMIVILTLVAFLFGAATYFAEKDTDRESFDSILIATYWAILTITSVGYGDMYPITPIGRILSCLCALFGAATMGMLISKIHQLLII
ncbi:hypothetical protein I4U23_005895 [Adineta vaga]|nr:hypothetical protein I4U23_005895 [Adineta vaga]